MTEICFSGRFEKLSRNELSSKLKQHGSYVADTISHKTGALVIGQDPKLLKRRDAEAMGVPIIDEQQFIKVLNSLNEDRLLTSAILTAIHSGTANSAMHSDENSRPRFVRTRNSITALTTPVLMPVARQRSAYHSEEIIHDNDSRSSVDEADTARPSKRQRTGAAANTKSHQHQPSPFVPVDPVVIKKVIALEGQIGVGKSTLSQKMLRRFGDVCGVYEEQTNQGFLKLFYGNTAKYGFAFQWGMLKTRIYQLKLAQHDQKTSTNPPNKFFVWDRSMIGDYIFALWNHLLGSISLEEMQVYESEFGGSIVTLEKIPFLMDIHTFVFLNDEPAACKRRVEQHRKNESEQGIPLPYYQGIDDIHFSILISLLHKRAAKAIVLNWGEYEDPEYVMNAVTDVLKNKRLPSVDYINAPPTHPRQDQLVYTNAEQINEAYTHVMHWPQSDTLKTTAKQYSAVYIPRNIMQIEPQSKGVVEAHRKRYDIDFYENAYKRVVMWHISQFHDVYFY